jgi:predicted AAA+ superfamily ATPase
LTRELAERRAAWFRSYLSSLLQRDVRDIANIEGLTEVPRLLGLLAARLGALMNVSEVSRASGIAQTTLRRYLSLLEATFIFQPLPAWSTNAGKRFVKSPKIHLLDTGLAAYLSGNTAAEALAASPALGALLESFVVQELRKQLAWSRSAASLYHFRRSTGREVDVVLEVPGGRVAGIEVKASGSVNRKDFSGLEALAEDAGKQFLRGAVLYLGERAVPFADNLWALPLSELWSGADPASSPVV